MFVLINKFIDKFFNLDLIISILLFSCCFIITASTIKSIGITWDEPIGYFQGAELIVDWSNDVINYLFKGNIKKIFSKDFVECYWKPPNPSTQESIYPNNHPPFSRYMSALFWILFHTFLEDIVCYRLSSAFLFSLLISFLYLMLSKYYGKITGIFASLSLFLMPRFFGHAHIAASDMPLTTLWFFSIYFFWKAFSSDKYKYKLLFAIFFGLTLITKFPAFIIPIPLFLFIVFYKRNAKKAILKIVLLTIIISPVIMIIANPTFWHNPIKKIFQNYILLCLNHSKIRPISKYYFGKVYIEKNPWHMPLVMSLITIPIQILITFFIGIIYIVKNRFKDELMALFLFNILILLSIIMLPYTNCYDGVRHFLPIFPFIAGISAVGFRWLFDLTFAWLKSFKSTYRISRLDCKIYFLLLIILFLPPSINLIAIHPYELSYYNELIGGIRGAFKKGMETTYWFDAANENFLNYINQNIPLESRLFVWPSNLQHFVYLQKKKYLRNDLIFTYKDFDYLIILFRQGLFTPEIWNIYNNAIPIYSITRDNIPLISIYKQ